jgi:hypothetical protein
MVELWRREGRREFANNGIRVRTLNPIVNSEIRDELIFL